MDLQDATLDDVEAVVVSKLLFRGSQTD